jgi:hypothetical protein
MRYTTSVRRHAEIGMVMRNANEHLGSECADYSPQAQADRLLPTLPRTSRCRFHDDADQFGENSRTAQRYNASDAEPEDES